ncbi:TetR/AcrR family transcriptional regulator [Amycolatopsis keratiniphila]|uniref:TetR family transcriptional regulator n=1 Tax=Amycolatopsis keratiniphila subsp. keratiniphila TaxID=227715 RepID=A0A1W2LJC2_9PSEU|nr:TetR/AcrR family transcriptional regulator [Amycolatopsis keratiniphila]ONF62949.1 TetR family transcriptional regulator [Amycolatopsis keratiniphila subsp. keratiniphila]
MPSPFSAEDRARITERLLDAGRALFATQGLRKTSLDDLVTPAGIAKSSFYAFFDSKEALYLELVLRQAPELHEQLATVTKEAENAREALGGFLRATVRILAENPLYHRLITHPEEMRAVARRMGPEEMARAEQVLPLPGFLAAARAKGQLVDADDDELTGVLQAVLLLPMHRQDIGEQRYPAVLDRLIDIVAAGLIKE